MSDGSKRQTSNFDSFRTLGESNWDVIVIGAGPAGSSAALELARANRSVLLLDAKKFPRAKVCGGCLNQPASEILESLLGTQHPVWNSSYKLTRFELHDKKRMVNLRLPTGRFLDRSILDQALVNQAVQCGATFVDGVSGTLELLQSSEEVLLRRVQISSGSQVISVTAKCVVIAVGLGSAFKRTATGPKILTEKLHAKVANGSRVGLAIEARSQTSEQQKNTIVMGVADEGYVGSTYLDRDRVHVAAAVDVADLRKLGPQSLVEKILADSGSPSLDFSAGRWAGTPQLTRCAGSLSGHRVFLVGDAARYVEPFTGEGIYWALKSGVGLARLIASGEACWSSDLGRRWHRWYQQNIQPSQRICRSIALGLRSPFSRAVARNVLTLQPRLANFLVTKINDR